MKRWLIPGIVPADADRIPGLRFSGRGALATEDQLAVLASRKVEAVKPTLSECTHSYPHIKAPDVAYGFQRTGIRHVVSMCLETGSALLADDMGLGKTMQSLFAVMNLLGKNDDSVVIACPRSVALTWVSEIKKWAGADARLIKSSKDAEKLNASDERPKYIVSSYDLVDKVDATPSVLLLDEGHNLKGRGTQRSKRIRTMAALSRYRIALTGTPIWDRPRDFWNLLDILWPGVFGNKFDFDIAYCNGQLNEWGGLENKGATLTAELRARLESGLMMRRTREQVKLELPALQRQVVWLEADQKASAEFRRSAIARQPGDMHRALEATLNAKVEAAVEEAVAADKCLVFTWMRQHAVEIHKQIEAAGKRCKLIHGGMTTALRNRQIEEAKREGASVVATIDSTGTGVDGLQHVAHIGIFHALDWRPLQLAQAEARLARIGQAQGVIWKYLALKDSADEAVIHTVVEKLDQARAVLGQRSNEALRNALSDSKTADDAQLLREIYERMGDQ